MSVEKIDWVVKITNESKLHLEPVEGKWGSFYAGSDKVGFNCIVVPYEEALKKQKFGLFKVLSESILYPSKCIKIEWDAENNDLALLFIDDLLRTENFLKSPISVIHKKKEVWKNIDENAFKKFLNELIGLWGEMAFVQRNPELAKYWNGPSGSDRDFGSDIFDLELKTTRRKSGNEVRISSVDQLNSQKEIFYLLLSGIEFSADDGISLSELYETVKDLNINISVGLKVESLMHKFGKIMCGMKFRIRFSEAYPIDDRFPVITRDLLERAIGRSKVRHLNNLKYEVNLTGLCKISEEELIKVIL